jgi:hypothetical protein
MPSIMVRSVAEIDTLQAQVCHAALNTAERLREFSLEGMKLLTALRFEPLADHPLRTGERLTLAEHLNQTFTDLVTFAGARLIFQRVHGIDGLLLRPGATSGGLDIVDTTGILVAAECFAGDPFTRNPRTGTTKLAGDLARVVSTPARHRFVFFYHPKHVAGHHQELWSESSVEIWRVEI